MAATLVAHVIPLLAWDPVADDAVKALRRVAERHVGELVDALVDPAQDFAIRRRLPRVLVACQSQPEDTVTATVPVPPVASKLLEVGQIE